MAEVEALDPDPGDPRLAAVGSEPEAWAGDRLLTVAVRREGRAPLLVGTVHEELRPAGDGIWALRLRVPRLDRACVELAVYIPGAAMPGRRSIWRGQAAPLAPAEPPVVEVEPPQTIAADEVAQRHPVTCWSPPEPRALLVCADGEGLDWIAAWIAAASVPAAVVGIVSAGLVVSRDEVEAYDPGADPRARAYLPDLDPPSFAAHMEYVVETVLPWTEKRFGGLPTFAFGVSNGAAWAASAGALHPQRFAGVLAFSLGAQPSSLRGPAPPHALVAGRLEPGFDRVTTLYARSLRAGGARVRLRRPTRGHDPSMWAEELVPALRWALAQR